MIVNNQNTAKPMARWWLPGSMTNRAEVIREIRMMKAGGFAGAEVKPIKTPNPALGRLDQGWGIDSWYDTLRLILEEARAQDFAIDLMIMTSGPLVMPLIDDVNDITQGARMELDGSFVDGITKERPFSGTLPMNEEALSDAEKAGGRAELFALTAARYIDKEKRILALDSAAALDIAAHVEKTGENTYTAHFAPEDAGEYVLFAWWQHPSGDVMGGQAQFDLYSRYGIKRLIDFFENTVFPRLGDAKKHISSLFVDSLECATHLDFTPGLREAFLAKNGYDIIPYLPALYEKSYAGRYKPASPDFRFERQNAQLENSWGDLLTDLYLENHVRPLRAFCHRHGMALRYQTAYGKLLELTRSAGEVDIPDTETLFGKDYIDFYRLQSGVVNIGGLPVYSAEASAERPGRGNGDENSGNFAQGFKKHLWHIQRAFAGGVNRVYFHGCRYRGQYDGAGNENGVVAGSHWPGFEPHKYLAGWSNSWDDRQPNWHAITQMNGFLERCQHVLQKGRQAVDLAFFHHRYFEPLDCYGAHKLFDSTVLEHRGYTYDFLGPAQLAAAEVDGGRLYPMSAAYKALILYRCHRLPTDLVQALIRFSQGGVPIIFCEGVPTEPAFFGEADISEGMTRLLSMASVRVCESAEALPEMLGEMGALPETAYTEPVPVLNVIRRAAECDYAYFYHYADADTFPMLADAKKRSFEARIRTDGVPYLYDPWTGGMEMLPYVREGERVCITLTLAPNDSRIVVLPHGGEMPKEAVPAKAMTAQRGMRLTHWTLELESWTAGKTPVDTNKEIVCTRSLAEPVFWTQLDDLREISGIGRYRSVFTLPDDWEDGCDAWLSLLQVEDGFNLYINGVYVPANQIEPLVNIGKWLRPGENRLEIEVCSTLLNAVLAYSRVSGFEVRGSFHEYGLRGPVILTI